jgi:hypothetical protein
MTTVIDIDDDSMRLLDLFWVASADQQLDLLRMVSVSLCWSLLRTDPEYEYERSSSSDATEFAESVLWRCMPRFPFWWTLPPDRGRSLEESVFRKIFVGQILDMIIGPQTVDGENAKEIAETLEFHLSIAYEGSTEVCFDVNDDESPPEIDQDRMATFINDWRNEFTLLLLIKQRDGQAGN